ncbi:sulfatase-like hydrolase/transferase [Algoriphagus jejuensis]|uniref:Sulfatase-like hydrolase/transferase n=1 Tax=Algoriphagus jejuensis TaxID=419934 RepID=A0ABP3YJD9_9BACT
MNLLKIHSPKNSSNGISQLLLLVVLCCLSTVSSSAQQKSEGAPRPNVIIFLTDDLGYGDLASYGNPIIKTPNLDQFAKEGVRMLDMHSAATVCSPSRASILTGRNAYRSGYYAIAGFFGTTLQKYEVTLPQLLKEVGYETAFFGKWHLSKLESPTEVSVNDMGFDYSLATSVNAFQTGPKNPAKFMRNGQPTGVLEGWYVDIISNDAADWIATKRDDDKPFFMIIATNEPHTPIDPPTNFAQLYDGPEVIKKAEATKYGGYSRPDKDISAFQKEYYGTVTQMDDSFGRLMAFLEKEGLKDNTLVIFTSDNGPEVPVIFGESGGEWEDNSRDKSFGTPGELRGMKRFPYEGGHRVPGIARWPGHIPAGTVSDQLFNGTDFLPTIAKLAGARVPEDRPIDGTDAFGAFLNTDYERAIPPMWFFPVNYPHLPGISNMAMRYGDYVLIGNLGPTWEDFNKQMTDSKTKQVDWLKTSVPTTFELYNIKNDLAQTTDLAQTESDTLMMLIPKMQQLWLDIRDEGPWWGRLPN